jgi:hypothetical protein
VRDGEEYRVSGGEMSWSRGDEDRGYFWVAEPDFGDLNGDGIEEAVIITLLNTGGTGRFTSVQILELRDGIPHLIAEIPGGDRGDGGIGDARVEDGALIVERLDSQPGDRACCPSQMTVERWQWDGSELVETIAARRSESIEPILR